MSGEIWLGGKRVAATSEWTLSHKQDLDVTYLTPLSEMSGSFSGVLEGDWTPFGDTAQTVYLYAPMPLPWWRRWAYILFSRWLEWPQVVISSGPARFSYDQTMSPTATISGQFKADGTWTVDFYSHPPFHRWLWDRLTEEW